MLRVRDVAEVARGFGEKVVGVNLEFAGTLFGNERLRDRGRSFEKAGDERLRAAEEEAKAVSRQAQAKAHERKQRAYQSDRDRGLTKSSGRDPSAGRAAAESAKGAVKEIAGKATGSERLEDEGREQRERGKDEGQAAKHDTKAAAHREKADVHREVAERRSS